MEDDGRGDWIRTSDLHTPSVMRYQAALRPDLAGASRQGRSARQGVRGAGVARRRRKGKASKWVGRVFMAILAVPAIYLLLALIGSLIPVNSAWKEPQQGITVDIADNGIHADIVMPVSAQGLEWSTVIARQSQRATRSASVVDPSTPLAVVSSTSHTDSAPS